MDNNQIGEMAQDAQVTREPTIGDLQNDLKRDVMGAPVVTEVAPSAIAEEAQHSSSALNTLAQSKVREEVARRSDASIPQSTGSFAEEVHEVMSAVNPEDPTQYVNARYFEQKGQGRGFTLYAEVEGDTAFPIVFENGVYITSSIAIVDAIHRTMENRRANISAHIAEISESRYEQLFAAQAQAQRLRATNGPVTTVVAGSSGRSPAELETENAKLKEEMQEMREKMRAIETSNAGDKPAKELPASKFGNFGKNNSGNE